jgi:crotonobetainyl-CoA:carnitine CoA-transferase CaiB-like acyl-CoA transferase
MSKWIDGEDETRCTQYLIGKDDMAAGYLQEVGSHQKAIAAFFMRHTKKDITEEGLKRGLNACAINTPADILANPQLKARDYWVDLNDSASGQSFRYPKFFFLSNETENFVRSAAPVAGEYNTALYLNELKLTDREIKELEKANVI